MGTRAPAARGRALAPSPRRPGGVYAPVIVTTSGSGTTRFVGRHRELATARRLLASSRLLTFTGPGGVGKSRLAVRLLEQRRGEGWLVDLADVTEPSLVGLAVLHRLGLRADAGTDPLNPLAELVGDTPGLLVLDQADRVRDTCRDLVTRLLERCPSVRVVVTSRQPLGIDGEQVLRIDPLPLPPLDDGDPGDPGDVGDIARADAVRLFVDRATSVSPGFALTDDNAATVARLCTALDGLPLAIELAAARSRELTPEAMLDRLGARPRLLGSRFRDVPERLGSLEASVAWSHELCPPAERLLWARLSVFHDGFELGGATYVCSDDGITPGQVAGLLADLVDRSIVVKDADADPAYHRMLAGVREHGARRLADDDPERWRARHRDWCLELAQEFAHRWPGRWQAWWLARMRRNHDNLVAAMEAGDAAALRIATSLEMYWVATGEIAAGRRWLEHALAGGEGTELERFRARCLSSYLATMLLDATSAEQEVATLRREVPPDPGARAALAHADAVLHLVRGDTEEGARIAAAGLLLAEAARDPTRELVLRITLTMLLKTGGHPEEERTVLTDTLDRTAELGASYVRSIALWIAGTDARDAGDLDRAVDLELEALALKAALQDHLGVALVLEVLATVASLRDDGPGAGRLLGAAGRVWRRVGLTPTSAPYAIAQRELAERLAEGVVEEQFARAYREGATTDTDALVAELLGRRTPRTEAAARPTPLTARELEVARLVGEGLTNQQIATRLVISVRTVHGHMENILRKLGFGSRAQVAAWVTRKG